MARTSPIAAFAFRDFRIFWSGFLLSNIGTMMQAFGLGWLVVQLAVSDGTPERAPLYLGFVGVSRAVPGLALGLFGWVVADRHDRRALLLPTQASYAAIATALPGLTLSGIINPPWVLVLSPLIAPPSSPYPPTRQDPHP